MKLSHLLAAGALAGSLLVSGAGQALARPAADDDVVPMQGNKFVPARITISAGTALTFINMDEEQHDVVEQNFAFESPLINPGEFWIVTFESPGTYVYFCDLHANMQGTIIVTG